MRRGCGGLQLQLRVWLRLRLRSPRPVASDSHFSGLEAPGFGFGFQIMIWEDTGFGFGFLNFKMESTGFDFGLGFLSASWIRLRLRSHQPGFQPNPDGYYGIKSRVYSVGSERIRSGGGPEPHPPNLG